MKMNNDSDEFFIRDIRDAVSIIIGELYKRGFETYMRTPVNSYKNFILSTRTKRDNPNRDMLVKDVMYFVKWDSAPYWAGIKELDPAVVRRHNLRGALVAINQEIYNKVVEPAGAHFLYALPKMIYFMSWNDIQSQAILDVPQKYNNEHVAMLPFDNFEEWLKK
jgi:hypothetical protein